jgi:hypothetical protein
MGYLMLMFEVSSPIGIDQPILIPTLEHILHSKLTGLDSFFLRFDPEKTALGHHPFALENLILPHPLGGILLEHTPNKTLYLGTQPGQ